MLQQVYLGKTASGVIGLFTNGMLACSLQRKPQLALPENLAQLQAYCKRMEFELITKPE